MQNKGSTSEQKEPTTDLPLKLGKDGKLTPQEHQCHLDNKLCLFCSTAGHIVKDCMKAASSKACSTKTKQENPVKNGFSDPNKEQVCQDWQRKDITNDHQAKALKEGCCEREWAWTSVSSREKTSTKRNLVRATTKSKSRMQTLTNGCVGWVSNELSLLTGIPMSETSLSEQDRSLEFLRVRFKRDKTYDN